MLLCAENLVKRYSGHRSFGEKHDVVALDDVSFSIAEGKTLAIAGPSGSGKSTLALCVACLERPTAGKILLQGREITGLPERDLRDVRPQVQIVFQDPALSLNPGFSANEIVAEPLRVSRKLTKTERFARGRKLLEFVGLSPRWENRKPAEFSGGQRQRLAIARALALEPKLLVLDEPFSALDCSIQAQIANLLLELQATLGLAYLFITHDLVMAAQMADEIAVMERGRIIEQGEREKILGQSTHDTTRKLLRSALPLNLSRGLKTS